MSIFTTSGRAALATALKANPLHVAWGTGTPEWDNDTPRESRSAQALTREIGRRKAKRVQYVTPSPDGEVVSLGGRYTASTTPTPHLHIHAEFDFEDGTGETIRELGVFIGTKIKASVPSGQRYYRPEDLESAGTLFAIDHITAVTRGVGSRMGFDFVITL